MATIAKKQPQPIRSTIPARLDRLRWSPFRTRLVLGLGTAWVLDGLSVTIASSVTSKLTQSNTLGLSTEQAASIGTVSKRPARPGPQRQRHPGSPRWRAIS